MHREASEIAMLVIKDGLQQRQNITHWDGRKADTVILSHLDPSVCTNSSNEREGERDGHHH